MVGAWGADCARPASRGVPFEDAVVESGWRLNGDEVGREVCNASVGYATSGEAPMVVGWNFCDSQSE